MVKHSTHKSERAAVPEPQEAASTLPLFFKQPVPLDARRHARAGLHPSQDLSFTAETNSIMINAVEFAEAAKQYPIVFTLAENPMPLAILGLEKQNYFVDASGQWKQDAYLPAYVRKYPFIFMDVPERNQFALCVDEGTPQYREHGGKDTLPLYNGDKASKLTNNALEFCAAFQGHYDLTRRFCEDLKAAELLEPTRSDAKLPNGREIRLAGFQVINEAKVQALPDAKILDFHKRGWLPLMYFAMMSSSNWKKLVDMGAQRESTSSEDSALKGSRESS